MKTVLNTVIVATSVVVLGVVCQAQVYSINGRPVVPPQGPSDEIRVTSYTYTAASNRSASVEWYVSTNALAMQPRWDGLSAEIPLSVQSACLLGLRDVTNHFPQVVSWSVESVSLSKPYIAKGERYADVWYYFIAFTPRDPEQGNHMEMDEQMWLRQLVLLDGTVVRPRRVAEKSKPDDG